MLDHDAIILQGFARSIIRRKARTITYCDGFTAQDRYDIEQELRLRLNESLTQFDPTHCARQRFHHHCCRAGRNQHFARTLGPETRFHRNPVARRADRTRQRQRITRSACRWSRHPPARFRHRSGRGIGGIAG